MPRLELLVWSDCPSHERARAIAVELLAELGLGGEPALSWIETDEEARRRGFVGSPTFRVDDVDPIPPLDDDVPGLACRVYRRRDGRVSPLPDPEQLREGLARLLGAG